MAPRILMAALALAPAAPLAAAARDESAAVLAADWEVHLGRRLGSRVAVAGDAVAAATLDRKCALLELASGRERWSVRCATGMQGGVSLSDDAVYAVTDFPDGRLTCFERGSGRERWATRLGESWGAPIVSGEWVLAAALSGRVLACRAEDGGRVWSAEVPGRIRAPLALSDSLLLVPTVSDTLIAIDARKGAVLWGASPRGALYSAPVILGARIWTLSYDGWLLAREPSRGEQVAARALPGFYRDGLAGGDGFLVALSTGGQLTVWDADSLTMLWETHLGSAASMRPTLCGEYVWVGLEDGAVHAFRLRDGRPLSSLGVIGPVAAPIACAGERVLIAAGNGELVAHRWTPAVAPGSPVPGGAVPPDATSESRAPSLWGHAPGRGGRLPHWFSIGTTRSSIALGIRADHPQGEWGASPFCTGDKSIRQERSSSRTALRYGCVAGWLLGAAAALWCQSEADRHFEDYERTGSAADRERSFSRAEGFDRGALGAWLASEAFFVVGLWAWLNGE